MEAGYAGLSCHRQVIWAVMMHLAISGTWRMNSCTLFLSFNVSASYKFAERGAVPGAKGASREELIALSLSTFAGFTGVFSLVMYELNFHARHLYWNLKG